MTRTNEVLWGGVIDVEGRGVEVMSFMPDDVGWKGVGSWCPVGCLLTDLSTQDDDLKEGSGLYIQSRAKWTGRNEAREILGWSYA